MQREIKQNQKEKPQAKTITVRFCQSPECRQTRKPNWTAFNAFHVGIVIDFGNISAFHFHMQAESHFLR